ncbi:MAG: class I SAM-dependent methyltransferase [Sulfurimonas sp.]|nr:class I SAM-dependent methyltransferase [Sulfurimonas sp.]
MEKIYMKNLDVLTNMMDESKNTVYNANAKVVVLSTMNMRYENIAFNADLKEHPYALTNTIVLDAIKQFEILQEISFLDNNLELSGCKSHYQEEKHEELFNIIWDKYNEEEYSVYVKRYVDRINFNKLDELIIGKDCIDFGCGNGVFCFAMLEKGANTVTGIDFGKDSIAFANKYSDMKNIKDKTNFKAATVYETGYDSDKFDFLVQNGVFHHTDNENLAIQEAKRVLKKDGWMWYYTDGEGGISYDLWDASVHMLKDVCAEFISNTLESMGIRREKIVHIMDGMSATYRHTSWDEITTRLSKFGFGNFKRLSGGTDTDFDLDVIEKDPYGREKFGEGDLRVLCQLLEK